MAQSDEVAGHVTDEAAALAGLPGTAVACGLHDATASALGIGGQAEGVVAIMAGTHSINEVLSATLWPRIERLGRDPEADAP